MIQNLKTIFLLSALLVVTQAVGQQLSSVGFQPDARTAGFAGAGVALDANAMSLFRNTAALSFANPEYTTQAAYGYMSLGEKNSFHSFGGYFRLNDKHTVALGARYFRPDKAFFSEDGTNVTTFRPYDIYIDAAYARRMTPSVSLSINLRYISSQLSNMPGLDKTTGTLGLDMGLFVQKKYFTIGASLSNLSMLMDYGAGEFRSPAHLKAGGSGFWKFLPDHTLTGSLEGRYTFMQSDYCYFSGSLGAEYCFRGQFAVRGGYYTSPDDKAAGNYGSVGAGVYLGPVVADFAWRFADPDKSIMNKVWMITAGIRF